MKSRSFSLAVLLIAMLSLCSCHSGNKNGTVRLPAGLVTNPNSASGKPDGDLPQMTFEQVEHDFGKIVEGETVSCDFDFTNTGKSDLLISEVSTSCGCTVPSYPKTPIRPGKSGVIKVAFNSKGKRGVQSKTIVVIANTQPNATQLRIKAKVVNPAEE